MIYFVTNRVTHQVEHENVTIADITLGKQISNSILSRGYANADFEASGLNTHLLNPVLFALGNETDQLVIDLFRIPLFDVIDRKQLHDTLLIGSNFGYDLKILKWHYKFDAGKIWDTERVDRRIFQGLAVSPSYTLGYRFNLAAQHIRHLKFLPESMQSKDDTRKRFIGQTRNSYVPINRDILYAAGDVEHLHEIKQQQDLLINKHNLRNYITYICNPLTKVMVDCELEGFAFNIEKWTNLIYKHEELQHESAFKLDKMVIELRDKLLNEEERLLLVGDKYTRTRPKQFLRKNLGLFGEVVSNKDYYGVKKPKINTGNINWDSSTQIIDIAARLKIPIPIKNDKDKADGNYAIPFIYKTHKKSKNGIEPVIEIAKDHKFTTSKDAFHLMLNVNPSISNREFYEEIITYRKYGHYVSSFGYNFLDKINPVTGKIHTIFRTETALTGRFQSGGGKKAPEYYNAQNIPRSNEFRHCFIADRGYSISTTDLGGAEVTILCDKAHDEVLYEWAVKNDDAHSPIATACWRNIFLWWSGLRAGLWKNIDDFYEKKYSSVLDSILANHKDEIAREYYRKSKEFTITRTLNKEYRQIFKNVTFAVLYGAGPKQVGITLSATKDKTSGQFIKATKYEGLIVIKTMSKAIPKTFDYLERSINDAFNTGIVRLNSRTNGRIFLPHIIRHLRDGMELTYMQQKDAEGVARNAPIQGTQADMLKESIVEINKVIVQQNLPCTLLKQVHDELVYKQKLEWDGHSDAWKKGNMSVNSSMFPFKGKLNNNDRVSIPQMINLMMCEIANRYLNHYKMKAETVVLPYWTK